MTLTLSVTLKDAKFRGQTFVGGKHAQPAAGFGLRSNRSGYGLRIWRGAIFKRASLFRVRFRKREKKWHLVASTIFSPAVVANADPGQCRFADLVSDHSHQFTLTANSATDYTAAFDSSNAHVRVEMQGAGETDANGSPIWTITALALTDAASLERMTFTGQSTVATASAYLIEAQVVSSLGQGKVVFFDEVICEVP